MSESYFADMVQELGGIPAALAAGIDPWNLPDGDVRSVWIELRRCWDRLMELSTEATDAPTRAQRHNPS